MLLRCGLFAISTTIHKVFETNSSFRVKYRTTGKVQFLFFKRFLPPLTNCLYIAEELSTRQ